MSRDWQDDRYRDRPAHDYDAGGRERHDAPRPDDAALRRAYTGRGGISESRWSGPDDRGYPGNGAREMFGGDDDIGRGGVPRYADSVGYMDRGYAPGGSGGGTRGAGPRGAPSWGGTGGGEGPHRGRGPKGYRRSDERIRDDVHDRLTEDPFLDASEITVTVKDGEVTLDGHVSARPDKRRAEDVTEAISGVSHVQNNLRLAPDRGSVGGSGVEGPYGAAGLVGGGLYSGLEGTGPNADDGRAGQTSAFSGKKTDLADRKSSS